MGYFQWTSTNSTGGVLYNSNSLYLDKMMKSSFVYPGDFDLNFNGYDAFEIGMSLNTSIVIFSNVVEIILNLILMVHLGLEIIRLILQE